MPILAADLLLERGVRFRLTAPFFLRWICPRYATIRALKLGTIIKIDKLSRSCSLSELSSKWNNTALSAEQAVPLSEAIALAVLNHPVKQQLFCKLLAWQLRWSLTGKSLLQLWQVVQSMNDVEAFTNSTALMMAIASLINMTGQKRSEHTEDSKAPSELSDSFVES